MKTRRVFITGEPGCGKTTVLKNVVEILRSRSINVGGIISGEIRENGVRVGFSLEDILTHTTGSLAHVHQTGGPTVGKYRVNLDDLASVGVQAMKRAIEEAEIIVVDELGPMELTSDAFIQSVRDALAAPNHLLATIHKRASHPLVQKIKNNPASKILEVTPENRDSMPAQLARMISI
ncbi:MAG TPA: NTPase [Candidatus Acidoferrales bacterium]|nr:NTPase [Candidatus Acidoferrales bacterium]